MPRYYKGMSNAFILIYQLLQGPFRNTKCGTVHSGPDWPTDITGLTRPPPHFMRKSVMGTYTVV